MYNPVRELSDICLEYNINLSESYLLMLDKVKQYSDRDYKIGKFVDVDQRIQFERFFAVYRNKLNKS